MLLLNLQLSTKKTYGSENSPDLALKTLAAMSDIGMVDTVGHEVEVSDLRCVYNAIKENLIPSQMKYCIESTIH